MKHKFLLILGFIVPLMLIILLKPAFTGSKAMLPKSVIKLSATGNFGVPGSAAYDRNMLIYSIKNGNQAALSKIMEDVDKNESLINRNHYSDNLRLYRMVSYYVGKIGYVDMKTHYFRNKLNRAPGTLYELLLQNERLPLKMRWILLPVESSLYHLQGPDGIYNLKFISADKFCEAVYNRYGTLLTEKNDPVNMGTFNYAAGIRQSNAHEKYDVTPYLKWGNTSDSPQKGYKAIQRGIRAAVMLYNQNITNVQIYRKNALSIITGKI